MPLNDLPPLVTMDQLYKKSHRAALIFSKVRLKIFIVLPDSIGVSHIRGGSNKVAVAYTTKISQSTTPMIP